MKKNCPNSQCIYFNSNHKVVKDGFYKRADCRQIQCFKCKACTTKFSASTGTLAYKQQKRRVNHMLYKLLCSGVSMRRAALLQNVSRETVSRRPKYFGKKYRQKNENDLKKLKNSVSSVHFDDLITKENSKLKPLSVTIAVDSNSRKILGAKVSQIPSFGHLAKVSRKKYGVRKCHHIDGIKSLFEQIKDCAKDNSVIISDKHKKYPDLVKKYFSNAVHQTYESERGSVAGLEELKKVKFDPLFAINHACAMFRANINRLIRKTWCTTKDPQRLQDHIDTFIYFFNNFYLKIFVLKILSPLDRGS